MMEDEHGDPVVRGVSPDATIYVPADRHHSTFNSGGEDMSPFVVYSPTGAEVVLRDSPGCCVIPVVCATTSTTGATAESRHRDGSGVDYFTP
jgi:oxalate decarboxylase/phosphoglucose isomerase-like protein (cupin superfamily)